MPPGYTVSLICEAHVQSYPQAAVFSEVLLTKGRERGRIQ